MSDFKDLDRLGIPVNAGSDTRKTYSMPSIDSVEVGDYVGGVDGPGQWPESDVWRVTAKVSSMWGTSLVIKKEDGRVENIHRFTNAGVGWYYLGKTPPSTKAINTGSDTRKYSAIFKDLEDMMRRITSLIENGELTEAEHMYHRFQGLKKSLKYKEEEQFTAAHEEDVNRIEAHFEPQVPFVRSSDGRGGLHKGDIVFLKGELGVRHKVLECRDERGDMPVILVEAQLPSFTIKPTKRVPRSDILSIVEHAQSDARPRQWRTHQSRF